MNGFSTGTLSGRSEAKPKAVAAPMTAAAGRTLSEPEKTWIKT
jgi:hypothetical protein